MAYTSLQLIIESYYDSGIVARDFETVSGSQINDGLIYLNDVIQEKRIDDGALPYYKSYTFDFVEGQELYYIADLIEIDTLVFYLDTVRYAMQAQKRRQFHGSPRAENIESLPTNWNIERILGGSNLYIYFLPNQAYPGTIWGLFALSSVTLEEDLSTGFDQYYRNFLEYELAKYLCMKYNREVPELLQQRLNKYDKLIRKRSGTLDLQTQIISTLDGHYQQGYAQVNLGRGWTTSTL